MDGVRRPFGRRFDILRAWKSGQDLAAEAIRRADRAMTVAERIDQLETMRRSAIALGWSTTDPVEVERVRARGSALHALLAAPR
jgi:hypothetical protein